VRDRSSKDDCSKVVVVDGDEEDNTDDNDDDDSRRRTHAFSLCGNNERERLLYMSVNSRVTVYTVTSSSLTNHKRPSHSRARFLLMYKGRRRRLVCITTNEYYQCIINVSRSI